MAGPTPAARNFVSWSRPMTRSWPQSQIHQEREAFATNFPSSTGAKNSTLESDGISSVNLDMDPHELKLYLLSTACQYDTGAPQKTTLSYQKGPASLILCFRRRSCWLCLSCSFAADTFIEPSGGWVFRYSYHLEGTKYFHSILCCGGQRG